MRRDQLNRRIQQTSLAAKAERRQSPQIIQQGRAVRAGGAGNRKAFAKTAAGSGNTIVCYLDTDSHDPADEITVTIEICGGSNLNAALPRLEDGTLLTVWNDAGTWRNAGNPFQASGDC